MRKSFASLLLALLLLACIAPATLADSDVPSIESTKQFLTYLDSKDIKYTFQGESDGKEVVKVSFGGDYMDTITANFFFSKDGEDVAIRIWDIISFDSSKFAAICDVANDLNCKYRFAKFTVDSDNTVTMAVDAVFRTNDVGEICYELMHRSVNICDEAYPMLSRYK